MQYLVLITGLCVIGIFTIAGIFALQMYIISRIPTEITIKSQHDHFDMGNINEPADSWEDVVYDKDGNAKDETAEINFDDVIKAVSNIMLDYEEDAK